jgi:hypothetical protein
MAQLRELTEQQLDRLIYEIGEDEARTLVYRMITPLNEADARIAYDEAIWWIEEEEEGPRVVLTAAEREEFEAERLREDEEEEDDWEDIFTDSNGQTQQPIVYNGVDYIIWNGAEVRTIEGVIVGRFDNGVFVWNA